MASMKKNRTFISPGHENETLKPKWHSASSFWAAWIRWTLAFSKDRYCQCNRSQTERTLTVQGYKASLVPRSCWCLVALGYASKFKSYILWSVGSADKNESHSSLFSLICLVSSSPLSAPYKLHCRWRNSWKSVDVNIKDLSVGKAGAQMVHWNQFKFIKARRCIKASATPGEHTEDRMLMGLMVMAELLSARDGGRLDRLMTALLRNNQLDAQTPGWRWCAWTLTCVWVRVRRRANSRIKAVL